MALKRCGRIGEEESGGTDGVDGGSRDSPSISLSETIERSSRLRRQAQRWMKMVLLAGAVLACFATSSLNDPARAFSSGPPASMTGAPGEGNCTACHSYFPVNYGLGSVSLGGMPTHYTPGQTLNLTVKTLHPDGFLYGFQLTVLDANGAQAGSLVAFDTANVQLVGGMVGNQSRTYLEQTFDGSFPLEFNQRVWSFSWISPPTDIGPVTFYLAGNGANGDHETTGDYIYLAQSSVACTGATPSSASFAAAGGDGSFALGSSCAWTAVSQSDWITITSPAQGAGDGSVSYSVDPNPLAISRSGSILIGGVNVPVAQGANFLDVDPISVFSEFIGKLSARGVTVGCGGGNYCPGASVTREQMAAFIMRGMGIFSPQGSPVPTFIDVPGSSVFYAFIEEMARRGITAGCGYDQQGNRLYCPNATVTREQMAAFIIRALGVFTPPTPSMQRFTDVPPTHVFYAFIEEMALRGITTGCGPGIYCPESAVTREQMAVFLVRAFDL